jgi:hypothetical protein
MPVTSASLLLVPVMYLGRIKKYILIMLSTESVNNPIFAHLAHHPYLQPYVKDEFGMELGYYDGDFHRQQSYIGGLDGASGNADHHIYTSNLMSNGNLTFTKNSLYNGNIAYWLSNTRAGQTNTYTSNSIAHHNLTGRLFRYDQWNRLT